MDAAEDNGSVSAMKKSKSAVMGARRKLQTEGERHGDSTKSRAIDAKGTANATVGVDH